MCRKNVFCENYLTKLSKIHFTALLLFITSAAFAQNTVIDSTATVITYWQKGERTKFSYKQTKEKIQGWQAERKGGSTSTVEVFVADATDKSYTIHWKYSNIKIESAEQNPLALKLAKLYEGLTIKFKTKRNGSI